MPSATQQPRGSQLVERWLPVLIGALLLAVMGAFVGLRLELSTDITHFLAAGDDARLAKLSRQLAESELTKTTILVIGSESGDTQAAIAAARALTETLAADEEVAWVRSGWADDQNQAVHDLYFPRRIYFTADSQAELEQRLAPAGLEQAATKLQNQLRLPTAAVIKRIAPEDPLLLYPAILERLEDARAGPLRVVEGQLVSESGEAVILFASVHSPFRSAHQGPLQERIAARFEQLAAEAQARGEQLHMRQSGVGRFALRAEAQIRGDIQRISTISMLGVITLFLLLFRSPRAIVLALLPLAAGVLAAASVCLLVFGRIHGLTLAFGASLIGVCIDYPIHLFSHHALEPDAAGPLGTARRIRPSMLVGALTTVAGFVGLGWTSFPGVREIGVFAAVGVFTAVLTTLWVLPPLLSERPWRVGVQHAVARGSASLLRRMQTRRLPLLLLPALALLLIGLALPRVEFEDDVSALTETDAELLAEDEAVRALVSRMDAGRMIVAIADDHEQALQKNDAVYQRLLAAREAGELEAFASLHELLWSRSLQQQNLAAYGQPASFGERLDAAFVGQGFRAGVFDPFIAELERLRAGQGAAPLSFADLAASPLREAASSMIVELGDGQIAVLTLMRNVTDPAALQARIGDLDDVHLFDQRALMAELYGRHRNQTLQLVGVGLLAVLAMIAIRYRALGPTLAAFMPALLAGSTALAILVLLGHPLTLLHVVSVLLVQSMGVDYGVFLAENRQRPERAAATVASLLGCCLSTVLAFGLLAMSSNPALQAIGLTVGIGVLASLVLAPTAMILFAGKQRA